MSAVEGGRFYREKGYCAISREANCGLSREDWRAWEHRVPASVAGMHAAREILLLPENAAENARIAASADLLPRQHGPSFPPGGRS